MTDSNPRIIIDGAVSAQDERNDDKMEQKEKTKSKKHHKGTGVGTKIKHFFEKIKVEKI
jgi:hypothetical protein